MRDFAPAWLALVAGWLISGAAAGWFWREAEQVDRRRFDAAVTNLLEHLDTRTERYAEQLERLADYVTGQDRVSTEVWEELVRRIDPMSNLPGFVELAYATNVAFLTHEEVEARRLGDLQKFYPDPLTAAMCAQWRNGTPVTAAETEAWISQPPKKQRWWRIQNGRMCSSLRRNLVGPRGQPMSAVGLFVPVFARDLTEFAGLLPAGRQEELRAFRCRGVLIGMLGWDAFLKTSMPGGTEQVAFDAFVGVEDGAPLTADTWMSRDGLAAPPPLAPGFNPRFRKAQGWPFYRTRWQLVFHSTPAFDRQSTRYRAWVALVGGMTLTSLMAGMLAVEVRGRHRQTLVSDRLQEALLGLESARRERERLSHDLHDGTIQSLYALQLGLSRAADQARGTQPWLGVRLAEYRQNLTAMIGELRGYILRHEAEDGPKGDLGGVLASLVDRLRSTTESELRTEISADAARRLSGPQAVHLANLAREALSNSMRHAQARHIHVALRMEDDRVVLEISDDGRGFAPLLAPQGGFGLTSMRRRAAEAGGELDLNSRPGQGCRIRVTVPTSGEEGPQD